MNKAVSSLNNSKTVARRQLETNYLTSKQEIQKWLNRQRIEYYTLEPDSTYGYVVNVEGGVILRDRNLTCVPVHFGKISGSLEVEGNQLTTLDFVNSVGESVFANKNKITTLLGCPEVGDSLCVQNNQLTSLEGCPTVIEGHLYCENNLLTSLKYCAHDIGGSLDCRNNQITSLEFVPENIGYALRLDHNLIDKNKLTHFPKAVGKIITFDKEKAYSFEEALVLHKNYLIELEKEKLEKIIFTPKKDSALIRKI